MRSSNGAFTLLEVMAAVAILALSYTTLASSGIIGLQREGEARRRIEASLVADGVLAEIETGIEAGGAPPLGREEREFDGFRVDVEITSFSIEIPEEEGPGGQRLSHARSRLQGDQEQAQDVIPGPSLLGGDGPSGAVSPLRRIDVRVVWDEGFGEREVSRTTFALDPEAAGPTIDAIEQAQAAAASAGAAPAQPGAPNPLGGGNQGTIGTGQ
jgi:prepilin-type N-terminal cleavage/methylation domain-containing protein